MENASNSITHQITLAAGLGIVIYAGLASGADWKEYYQYFNESKFVSHSTINTYLLDIVIVSHISFIFRIEELH